MGFFSLLACLDSATDYGVAILLPALFIIKNIDKKVACQDEFKRLRLFIKIAADLSGVVRVIISIAFLILSGMNIWIVLSLGMQTLGYFHNKYLDTVVCNRTFKALNGTYFQRKITRRQMHHITNPLRGLDYSVMAYSLLLLQENTRQAPDVAPKHQFHWDALMNPNLNFDQALKIIKTALDPDAEKIYIPYVIHSKTGGTGHYALAVINIRSRTIECYDSLPSYNKDQIACCEKIKAALKTAWSTQEMQQKVGNIDDWDIFIPTQYQGVGFPEQDSSSMDCGFFVYKYAESLVNEKPFQFESMPKIRQNLAAMLLKKSKKSLQTSNIG
ncbi:MAG: hypothetical protein H0X51_01880 [Parachlamydiaceae bacterium]|nr:hypothetical protein [Parachlamydiaceae bacterium]